MKPYYDTQVACWPSLLNSLLAERTYEKWVCSVLIGTSEILRAREVSRICDTSLTMAVIVLNEYDVYISPKNEKARNPNPHLEDVLCEWTNTYHRIVVNAGPLLTRQDRMEIVSRFPKDKYYFEGIVWETPRTRHHSEYEKPFPEEGFDDVIYHIL